MKLLLLFLLLPFLSHSQDSTKGTCQQQAYSDWVTCVSHCPPYGGAGMCLKDCEVIYWVKMAVCGSMSRVVRVRGDKIRLHISHRWFWVRNKYGNKKGDRVWVIVNGEK